MRLIKKEGAYIAENATVVGNVTIGKQSSIWYNVVIRGDDAAVRIGEYTNIQEGSVLHPNPGVDMFIGNHVTIGHGVMMHGRSMGDYSTLGIGSIILGGAEIGERSIVAAGALVTENAIIPPRSLVMGVPGKVVRQVSEAEEMLAAGRALRYADIAKEASGR